MDLSDGQESFYHLDYHKDTWMGDVIARDISSLARVQTTGPWDEADPTLATAASILDTVNFNTGRTIVTHGSPFRWANMTADEKTALGSEDVLDYVRGDRSNEEPNGNSYYKRDSVFGNILHSNLYYLNDGTNETLFVGANDGMLHVIDALTGNEHFSYIPSMLIPKLEKLTRIPFIHTHYVDGPLSVARMDISDNVKTILVGGLGAGGKGLYALNVTTPTTTSETDAASKVMWEITATGDFANLGHTYGTPRLTRLPNGTAAVVVGNGYMNTGNGHAVLYVINANTGALISEIDTGSGSATSPNGLSTPTLYDTDGDSRPEYAYAGDIDGNMWKFDLSTNTASLLFRTMPTQAITTAPVIRQHPYPYWGQMVAFATGRILSSGDETDTSVHFAYGIWDGAPEANTQILTQIHAPLFGNNLCRKNSQ